jgi:hypothetical protein
MITKDLLERNFPSFRLHGANFRNTYYFMLFRQDLSIHVEIMKDTRQANIEIYQQANVIHSTKVDEDAVIEYLRIKIKEHGEFHDGPNKYTN